MKRYENLIVSHVEADHNDSGVMEGLDDLGNVGWKLVNVVKVDSILRYYLVREVEITIVSWRFRNVFTRLHWGS